MFSSWYQLKAILWKNWLQKKAHFSGFLAELLLPVFFMVLLIMIKQITDVYDSPNIAYFCGNVYPWFYGETINVNDPLSTTSPLLCTQKPATCTADSYYNAGFDLDIYGHEVKGYSEYGYIPSSASAGTANNPFYTFTVGDEAPYLNYYYDFDNPSYSYCYMLSRLYYTGYPPVSLIAVAPSSTDAYTEAQAQSLYNYLRSYPDCSYYSTVFKYFDSESALNDYMTDKDYDDVGYGNGKIAYAVVLNSANVADAQFDYSIRVNYTGPFNQGDKTVSCLYGGCDFKYTIPTTKFYTNDLVKPQSSEYLYGYSFSGFSTLQKTVDEYIFKLYNGGTQPDVRASLGIMPTASYKSDDFQYVISSTLGIFYMLSFLYPVSRLIRALVLEKECRIKEGMKMMGLTDTIYNTSWLITAVLQMTLVSILITLVSSSTVFQYSNKFFVFMYFEAFSLAIISMCFLLATFFSRSKTASLLGPMIFFASFFPYYAVSDAQYSTSSKTATCLSAPACFALGANVFANYEGGLVGVQSDNVNQATSNFTYSACLGMLFFDAFFYGILAFYLDKVIPSEFGTALPFYFPLLPSYWCGASCSSHKDAYGGPLFGWFFTLIGWNSYRRVSQEAELARGSTNQPGLASNLLSEDVEAIDPKKSHYFEATSAELRQQIQEEKCVSIRKLRKVFKNPAGGDDRVAVHGLNLELFQNQVTVLLGHNGAGKTTTISMLVGMTAPTSGNAVLPGGLDIQHDMAAIRRNLGVCPQHDILFPELTALQHLEIFAAFKGVAPSEVHNEAMKMIAEVGLKEKANAKSSTLSGGQKRKLSLGIALIGDSKVVILDEPTSGMDPFSRRSTWNIIQRNKKGRVILLTTHFMDEADLLGDRVAIMAHGKLQCCGSPLFLKNRFGVGYTLTVVKESLSKVDSQTLAQISEKIKQLVHSFVPSAEPLSDVGAEQSFRLPFSASNQFVSMFGSLDRRKGELAIAEYGISVTTLEEVFIRVADLEEAEEEEEDEQPVVAIGSATACGLTSSRTPSDDSGGIVRKMTGTGGLKATKDEKGGETNFSASEGLLRQDYKEFEESNPFWKHFSALLIKRAIYAKRDTRMIVCQLILPVILVIFGLSLLLIKPDLNQPDLVLNPSKLNPDFSYYQQNYVPFWRPSDDSCPTCASMEDQFQGTEGTGVWGVAMPVSVDASNGDAFQGCAVGAAPLNNVSQYLIYTPEADLKQESGSTIYGTVAVAEGTDTTHLYYNVLVNASSLHSAGIYMNLVHQSYLQVISGKPAATIVTHNHPLPQTYKEQNQQATIDAFVVSLFCMIAFCFVPASFAVFVVKEREVKAKHQQVISGVSIYAYWISTFLWDCVSYLPTAALVIAIMYAYDIEAYTQGPAASAVATLLLLYGPATAAITYMISFLFVSHSTAQVVVMFFNFISGLCMMVVSFVLTAIPNTSEMNLKLRYFFRLFPSFCLGDGILQLALCSEGKECPSIDRNGYNIEKTQGPFSWDTAGGDITFLAIEAIVYFLIALLIEYLLTFPSLLAWLYKIEDPGVTAAELAEDDVDVAKERIRVQQGGANNDIVKIEELRKIYPANSRAGGINVTSLLCPPTKQNIKVAVHSLSFGIPKGECFGFLGINGAGKTTTLSILSGEFPPTDGNAFIDNFSIALDQSKIRRKIGYCPQFDALLELLTVREHLELYGRIKGLQGQALEEVVMKKMEQLDLLDFENKTAGSLSGGNKRKLSVAVATVGDPPIVFLDEPSTGMDPKARRFMWKVIARMSTQDAHCSVILTTHSMEEAEALCTRIGIMVNGRLRCLGSSQHLKHRFGNGFEVNIKTLAPTEESLLNALKAVRTQTTVGALANNIQTTSSNPLSRSANEEMSLELLDRVRIAPNEFVAVAQALNNRQKLQEIHPFGSGAMIHEAVQGDGSVGARLFLEWWINEDIFHNLQQFMDIQFPGRVQLLERSGAQSFRYRIKKTGEGDEEEGGKGSNNAGGSTNALSEIFAKLEEKKVSLHVAEYSVGQTTLEQIFNQFASQQDNPEVAMTLAAQQGQTRSSTVRVD